MKQAYLILVICLSLELNQTAASAASAFTPKVTEVCSVSPENPKTLILDHKKLVGQLVEKYAGISAIDLDSNGGGITDKQEAQALMDPESFCRTSACGEKTASKLGGAFITLVNFLNRNAMPIDPAKGGIDTHKLTSPDLERQALLIRNFIRGNAETETALCLLPPAPAKPKENPRNNPNNAVGGQANEPGRNGSGVQGFFSLRQNVEDLPIPQASNKFKGLKQASVSYTDDWVAKKSSFAINAAAGYTIGRISLDQAGDYIGQVTPFVTYDQQYVQTTNAKNNVRAQNVGFGLLGDLTFPAAIGYQNLKFYPKYVQSLRNEAEVLSGNFVYTPMYGVPGIDSAFDIIPDLIAARFTPQAKFVFQDVLTPGTNQTLLKSGSYHWFGPRLDLTLFGEGLFEGITYDVSYETYNVTGGIIKNLSLFQTSLGYDFGSAKLMSIQIKYQKGRNLDTFEQINQVSLGLGLKY